jgi:hypothetical protein
MTKFEILESYNFRGGNHYCTFYANSIDRVLDELKDAWYGSGISRHEGELFLSAYLENDIGEETELFFRHCSVYRDRVHFNFSVFNGEFDPWYQHGIFIVDETDDVKKILKKLFEYDSPDRVIGSYLYRANKNFNTYANEIKDNFDATLLANILSFGKKEQKLEELAGWLFSKNGIKYLNQLGSSIDLDDPEVSKIFESKSIDELNSFIDKHTRDLGLNIYLPSRI